MQNSTRLSAWIFLLALPGLASALPALADDPAFDVGFLKSEYRVIDVGTFVVPGAALGVTAGDIVQSIDGKRVHDSLEAADILLSRSSSIRVVRIVRNGHRLVLKKPTA